MTTTGLKEPDCAPVLVRIAGLAADTVERFSTDLGSLLRAGRDLDAALTAAREELVEGLFAAVHGARPEDRRLLLAAKRDSFNGRSLAKYRRNPAQWALLEEAVGALARRVLELEEALARSRTAFRAAYQLERRRQQELLASLLDEPNFLCGLAVSSSLVAENCHRLRGEAAGRWGRRERRLGQTVLRYLSRAALKLSPFSTLTPVALGRLDAGEACVSLLGETWHERSLMRLKRYLLDQYTEVLRRYPPFRARLSVVVNESLWRDPAGHVLFLRPSYWLVDGEGRKFRYHRESLVKLRLGGRLVESLERRLAGGGTRYCQLIADLAQEFGAAMAPSQLEEEIDRLVSAGYLLLVLPWSEQEGHLEKRILEELGRLPADPLLDAFRACLSRLVALEEGILGSDDPAAVMAELEKLIDQLWRTAAPLGGLSPEVEYGRASQHNLYQDTLRSCPTAQREIVHIGVGPARRAVASVEPLVRLTALFDRRLDFLHTLGAFIARTWTQRRVVGLLEVFAAVQPLWQEFVRFQIRSREQRWWESWNPLGLPEIAGLAEHRRRVWEALPGCACEEQGGRRYRAESLASLFEGIPSRYVSTVGGACLFLQPLDGEGSQWMLNRLKEGTGRFASRYTPVLDEENRDRYTAALEARGRLEVDGEMVELLDLQCIQGDTLNVHAPQTPRTLTLPGERTAAPPESRRTLGDLVVCLSGDGWPELRDRQGQRFLPVHLGVGYHDYMPTLIKFLCGFGPSEMAAVFPLAASRHRAEMVIQERTLLGNVVLHRQSWTFPAGQLRPALEAADEAAAFEALVAWREEEGIPEQVFWIETVKHPIRDDRLRPQFLDLSSPLFVNLLLSSLEGGAGTVTFVEALPRSSAFPADETGRRWAVEILLDSLALGRPAAEIHRTQIPKASRRA